MRAGGIRAARLVEEMEAGELPLEEAMRKFERGITLARDCQTALRDAEQKVEILSAVGITVAPNPSAMGATMPVAAAKTVAVEVTAR